MKRTSYGVRRANSANGTASSSVKSRIATALILIGWASGYSGEISQPAQHLRQRVAPGELEEAVALERVDRHVEAVDAGADQRLGVALEQVSVGGDGQVGDVLDAAEHRGQTVGKSRRTSGSPPVSRTSWTPIAANRATSRAISSKVRISSRSSHGRPSAGMQYWQRKLQRSVTDTRRSPISRPCPSLEWLERHR